MKIRPRYYFFIVVFISILSFTYIMIKIYGTNKLESSPYTNLNDFEGITMNVVTDTESSKGASVIFENSTNYLCVYGEPYYLEKKINGNWYKAPIIFKDSYGWNMIAYDVIQGTTSEWGVDWEWIYGNLEPGSYRIVKQINVYVSETEYEVHMVSSKFNIH